MTAAARPSVTPRVGDQITTAAQLAALPRGTVLIDHAGVAWQRDLRNRPREDMWLCAGGGPQGLEQPYFVVYYGPFTVVRVPGVDPDRPSVTDNARDEEPLAWCPGCGDRILTRVVRERGVCSECWGTRDDPWAAGRAETTTEDAAQVIERAAEVLVRDLTYSTGWDAEANDAIARTQAEALAESGLLATARTESIPHRDELAQAVMEATVPFRGPGGRTAPYVMPVHYAIADAVLALLGGDDK